MAGRLKDARDEGYDDATVFESDHPEDEGG